MQALHVIAHAVFVGVDAVDREFAGLARIGRQLGKVLAECRSVGAATLGLMGEAQISFASFGADVGAVSPIAEVTAPRRSESSASHTTTAITTSRIGHQRFIGFPLRIPIVNPMLL